MQSIIPKSSFSRLFKLQIQVKIIFVNYLGNVMNFSKEFLFKTCNFLLIKMHNMMIKLLINLFSFFIFSLKENVSLCKVYLSNVILNIFLGNVFQIKCRFVCLLNEIFLYNIIKITVTM